MHRRGKTWVDERTLVHSIKAFENTGLANRGIEHPRDVFRFQTPGPSQPYHI